MTTVPLKQAILDDEDLSFDYVEEELLRNIAEHASDLKLADEDAEFCALNGGIETLKNELFESVKEWEDFLDENGV